MYLILYENDVKYKIPKISQKSCTGQFLMFEVWDFDYWYLKWIYPGKRWNG